MLHIALFEPEIPPNTGNIIRLSANTGAQLHLIHPLGFQLDEKPLRRAGLDYHEWANVIEHADFSAFQKATSGQRLLACTTKATQRYTDVSFQKNDVLLLGPETRGLPQEILSAYPEEQKIKIPMKAESRSLNLSNAAAVILYEAIRQIGFDAL